MGSSYDLLISKINEFTRKFYLNKLLRGSIYAASCILLAYLLLFTSIYYLNPGIWVKTTLFFSFITLSVLALGYWIARPGLAFFKLGENLSAEQAAKLIGDHFFTVKDKLLNTLQLKALAESSPHQSQLILAGIDQKIEALRPIPFSSAINLNENRKYIKFIIAPLFVIFLIGMIAPTIILEGTSNFIRYDEEIQPKAPFGFNLVNSNLNVIQGDDLKIELKLTGNEFPRDLYIEHGSNSYKIERENISNFNYTLKNIQQTFSFRFSGGGFSSRSFTVNVNPRPTLLNMSATLVFPAYINRKTEQISNVGDMLVPEGTKITWNLTTENSSSLSFVLREVEHPLTVKNNIASFSSVLKSNGNYRIIPRNNLVMASDSLNHQIAVIVDQLPAIEVNESQDSISSKALYFSGAITDDYGFSALKFKYSIIQEGKVVAQQSIPISIKNTQLENAFFHMWDLNTINLKEGQSLTYYFEVADNDGVNGPKIARSPIKTYKAPSAQEIAAKIAEGSDALKRKMESTIKLASTIEKDSKKLSQNLLDKKQISFEDKKQIEQLLDKRKQLEEAVKEIKKQNEKNAFEKNENNAINEELKEKQKKIDDLFNNVLDEKTKELLQKLQRLMDLNNKDQTREELSKMQKDNKGLKNELDRILELYKQLEFEQSLQNKVDRLNEIAQQQKQLSQQSKDKNSAANDIKTKQETLNKDFKNLKEELKDLSEKNQSLDRPNPFENPEKETQSIEKNLQESKDQLEKDNKQKASEKQEDAAREMDDLAQKMSQAQQEGDEKASEINAKELRRLLENLLNTSFEQEKVMLSLRKMATNDPSYVSSVQKQNIIKDNMKTITDSLFSLSKRVPQIESTVNSEVDKINFNIEKSIAQLGDRRTPEANRHQQITMTSINNLALMLNEALDQLQNSNKKGGKGKKQSMQQLQKMQEQLNKNMQNAREKMQQEGNQGTVPKGQMTREFAEMAKQQQMIREALQKINSEENKDGNGGLGNLNQTIKEMKQTEMDLVNKKIAEETMNRQKNLLTKLLDADKAQREQDEDAKRESNAAKAFPPSYQQMLEKFNKQQKSESELIQKLPPNLNYYYKNKIAEYFKLLNSPS
ncbi:MAG: hypothetical protein EOO90_01330 [Pedobacter sp.]|nr:MAG: hypothetical protein EOO90_01330 [Pedobacter sp.]